VRRHFFPLGLFLIIPILVSEIPGRRGNLPRPNQPGDFALSLGLLTRHAGLIFSGTALKVEHLNSDATSAVATTLITFRVQTAIRGVRRGQVITVREWDGLWNCGERYRPGERVLLFLFPASRLGLTSPVGGRLGRFRVDHADRVWVEDMYGNGKRSEAIDRRTFAAEVRRAAKE